LKKPGCENSKRKNKAVKKQTKSQKKGKSEKQVEIVNVFDVETSFKSVSLRIRIKTVT
jgi:hypothetical protein